MTDLVELYDCALFDLDGVLYLGPSAVPGASEAVQGLRRRQVRVGYVTNNAARTPDQVAAHLVELGIPARVEDVVTSAQAGARMLADQLPAKSKVLVVGTGALAAEVEKVGLEPVWSSSEMPAAVIQGYDPQMTWPRLDDACYAIQAGAKWFATNTDSNRPTDRGRVPGAGAQVGAVATSVDVNPMVAGKPFRPLLDETIARLKARTPIFVGDRIDTDIMGANEVGIDSLFVFTGTHGKYDLASAPREGQPTWIGQDAGSLLLEKREAVLGRGMATCRAQRAIVVNGQVRLDQVPADLEGQLDALWAVLNLLWTNPGFETETLEELNLVQ